MEPIQAVLTFSNNHLVTLNRSTKRLIIIGDCLALPVLMYLAHALKLDSFTLPADDWQTVLLTPLVCHPFLQPAGFIRQ